MFSEGRERLMANVRQRYSFPPDSEVELGVGSFPAATSPGSEPLSWSRTIENLLWQFAAVFAIYYGDSRHHLCHVLFFDTRVRRIPFLLGFASLAIGAAISTYLAVWFRHILKCEDKWELIAPTAIPTATLVGLTSLLLFSVALWPIWDVLSLPLLVNSGSNPSSS
ncbi:uncharacterized protein [Physcomitrium patens]|uniref:uncharacterized protein isoform X2 n=1 Tax=Physcomitrium patens TaxID=3218 RepID=UPI000D1558CC|nr:transmembrane protein 128-like isoform X1 [Physcomitrium patens]XP_024365679.1 transmembrane protein 128-like isoform X1 [Physcomitrium patens]|eukprot:XP_024365678.1 transmembrane protein 128-like isoform X1 [Physcomitrella patens]